jgi:hypothetical protein
MRSSVIAKKLEKIIDKAGTIYEKEIRLDEIEALLSYLPEVSEVHRKEALILEKLNKEHPEFEISIPPILNSEDFTGLLLSKAIEKRRPALINLLLKKPINPNIVNPNSDYYTPLMRAVNGLNISLINQIIELKADPNIIGGWGNETVLMQNISVRHNHMCYKIHKILMDAKADPNITNEKKETVLMHAAQTSNIDIIKQLLTEAKVSPNEKDQYGHNALYHALFNARRQGCSYNSWSVDTLPAITILLKNGCHIADPEFLFNSLMGRKVDDETAPLILDCMTQLSHQLKQQPILTKLFTKNGQEFAKLLTKVEEERLKLVTYVPGVENTSQVTAAGYECDESDRFPSEILRKNQM